MAMNKIPNVQDKFLNIVRRSKAPVTLYLMNGFQLHGTIYSFDEFSVVLEVGSRQSLIYKHAISTISPDKPINMKEPDDRNTDTSSEPEQPEPKPEVKVVNDCQPNTDIAPEAE